MEQVNVRSLPIAGKIQHGLQEDNGKGKRVKELGYFITKIDNDNIKYLQNRFNEKYPKQKKIKVRFFDEEPLTIRDIRYNTGGAVCYCMEGKTEGKRKVSGKWEPVHCSEECEHKKFERGKTKPACNREGTLKFMLPEITTDRIWLMKIKGQTSIDNLRDYIYFQKFQGNSLIGDYYLVLNQKEQTNYEGKKFYNYILEIYKEELNSNEVIPENNNKVEVRNTVTESVIKNEESKPKSEEVKTSEPKETVKPSVKKETKVESKAVESKENTKETKKKKETVKTTKSTSDVKVENYYALVGTTKKIIQKDNKPKEYVIGNFVDSEDKVIDVYIKDEFAEELLKCDLGTLVELELATAGDKTFTNNVKYIQKCIKNVAA